MRADMVQAYLKELLEAMTGSRPVPDPDGDLLVQMLGAQFYVRVANPTDPIVQVFSVALADVTGTPELYTALNEINTELGFARAFHVAEQVLIETEIWGSDVNPANFEHACSNVAKATDAFGSDLHARFGGVPRFQLSKQAPEPEPTSASTAAGPYL